jgi:hypothetical protein
MWPRKNGPIRKVLPGHIKLPKYGAIEMILHSKKRLLQFFF